MMRLHGDLLQPAYRPAALAQISPVMQRMVTIGEDSRFRFHHGLDFAEIADALGLRPGADVGTTVRAVWRHRDRLRGASTITQQVAKNLYLSPSRNPLRKIKEAITALRLELVLPKDRIMELYLNVVELGPGVWGVPAAARKYFGESPDGLDETEAAALAATLPHPLTSNPGYRPARMLERRDLILARYHGVPVYLPPDTGLDSLLIPPITPPLIPPVIDSLADSVLVPAPELRADSVTDSLGDSVRDTGRNSSRESRRPRSGRQ
jgi:monofunctional biosynthetic peptidoglycan transglycosylase